MSKRARAACYLLTGTMEWYTCRMPGTLWRTVPTLPRSTSVPMQLPNSEWTSGLVLTAVLLTAWLWERTCGNCERITVREFAVQIVTAINNSFWSTQLTQGFLRIAWFDLCLPQLYPQSEKRDLTTYSQLSWFWLGQVNLISSQCLVQCYVFEIQYKNNIDNTLMFWLLFYSAYPESRTF